jgi:predicted DNA-binding transcriptional regulator AlpA
MFNPIKSKKMMTKEELQEILHELELDYEAEPTLIFLFYTTPDGRVNNFSISVRRGGHLSDRQLERLIRREYPATRQGVLFHAERPESTPDDKEWLDVSEACRMLHISRKTLWKWTKRGLFTPSKVEGMVYYSRTEINDVITSNLMQENGRVDKTALDEKGLLPSRNTSYLEGK